MRSIALVIAVLSLAPGRARISQAEPAPKPEPAAQADPSLLGTYIDDRTELPSGSTFVLAMDVIGAYDRESDTSTPLKKKNFLRSDEYKQLYAELWTRRKELLAGKFYLKYRIKVPNFDLKRHEFRFRWGESDYGNSNNVGDKPRPSCWDAVCYPSLALVSEYLNSAGCDWGAGCTKELVQYIAIKAKDDVATKIEELGYVTLYLTFSIGGQTKSYEVKAKSVGVVITSVGDDQVLLTRSPK